MKILIFSALLIYKLQIFFGYLFMVNSHVSLTSSISSWGILFMSVFRKGVFLMLTSKLLFVIVVQWLGRV